LPAQDPPARLQAINGGASRDAREAFRDVLYQELEVFGRVGTGEEPDRVKIVGVSAGFAADNVPQISGEDRVWQLAGQHFHRWRAMLKDVLKGGHGEPLSNSGR
jgi:hypothetical protein